MCTDSGNSWDRQACSLLGIAWVPVALAEPESHRWLAQLCSSWRGRRHTGWRQQRSFNSTVPSIAQACWLDACRLGSWRIPSCVPSMPSVSPSCRRTCSWPAVSAATRIICGSMHPTEVACEICCSSIATSSLGGMSRCARKSSSLYNPACGQASRHKLQSSLYIPIHLYKIEQLSAESTDKFSTFFCSCKVAA